MGLELRNVVFPSEPLFWVRGQNSTLVVDRASVRRTAGFTHVSLALSIVPCPMCSSSSFEAEVRSG